MARHEQVLSVYPELEKRFDLSYVVRAGNTLYLSGLAHPGALLEVHATAVLDQVASA